MIWIQLSVDAEAEAVESVSELFSRLGHGGVAVEEPLSESAEPGQIEIDPGRPVTVKTYIPDDEDAAERIRGIEEGLWHLSQLRRIEPLHVTRLAEEDWAEAWKEFFYVQRIGERLVIKPSWREYQPEPDEVVLELDPGMAFGTGLHPTTRTCLVACERWLRPGMRVLDVGTGSGVLSIAAAKLGAASVLALDVDPVAVEVARKNVDLNGLSARVRVAAGSLDALRSGDDESTPGRPAAFDLVLANIIARVLVELSEGLYDATVPGGLLVASGIITERETEVRDALTSAGFQLVETLSEGDWRTLVCRHGDA